MASRNARTRGPMWMAASKSSIVATVVRTLSRTLIALLVVVAPASAERVDYADLTATGSVAPGVLEWGTTQQVTWRIELHAGPSPVHFRIDTEPLWRFDDDPNATGLLLAQDLPTAQGDVESLVPVQYGATAVGALCDTHGTGRTPLGAEGDLPAGGTGAVLFTARPGPDAPWPGADPRLRFTVTAPAIGPVVLVPDLRLSGQRGVVIGLSGPARRGAPLLGTTDPAIPGETLQVTYDPLAPHASSPPPRTVTVGPDGRFTVDTSGARSGTVEVTYAGSRADIGPSHGCGFLGLAEPPPSPRQAVTDRRKLRVSRRRVEVRIACPDGAGGCAGSVRLRAGGRTLGSVRYALASGQRATKVIRLARAPRRAVRVSVQLRP